MKKTVMLGMACLVSSIISGMGQFPKELKHIILGYLDEYDYECGINIDYQSMVRGVNPTESPDFRSKQVVQYSRDRRYAVQAQVLAIRRLNAYNDAGVSQLDINIFADNREILSPQMKEPLNEDREELYQLTGKVADKNALRAVVYCEDHCKSLWVFDTGLYLYDKNRPGIVIFRLMRDKNMHCLGIAPDFSKIAVGDSACIKIYKITQDVSKNATAQPLIINRISMFGDYKVMALIIHKNSTVIARLEWINDREKMHQGRFVFWKNQREEVGSILNELRWPK